MHVKIYTYIHVHINYTGICQNKYICIYNICYYRYIIYVVYGVKSVHSGHSGYILSIVERSPLSFMSGLERVVIDQFIDKCPLRQVLFFIQLSLMQTVRHTCRSVDNKPAQNQNFDAHV